MPKGILESTIDYKLYGTFKTNTSEEKQKRISTTAQKSPRKPPHNRE